MTLKLVDVDSRKIVVNPGSDYLLRVAINPSDKPKLYVVVVHTYEEVKEE